MAVRRRNFLMGGLALPFLPSPLGGQTFRPRYREQTPFDVSLGKLKPGADEFTSEKDHDAIASVLSEWSAALLGSPSTPFLTKSLAPGFLGCTLTPGESKIVRPGPELEVRRVGYPKSGERPDGAMFLAEFRQWIGAFSRLRVADFQITRINAGRTRVRYELAGSGPGFHIEERIGFWDLEWEGTQVRRPQVRRWMVADMETRSRAAKPWFVDVTGHAFGLQPQLAHGVDYWRTVLDGATGIDLYGHNGVAAGDIDADGFEDLYVCQPAGLPNKLFRNRGDGTFEDITDSSGTGLLDNTACALFADLNNNGRQDLIVVRATGPVLFVNEGGGKFRLRTDAFEFAVPPQGTFTGAAIADYDRDGWLDVYFCLYTYYQGAGQYKYPIPYYAAENGPPNFLMRNNRDGTFRDVTAQAGLNQNNTRYSFCCGWGDFNRDGWPDLYVVNDFGRKNLYRNNGDGTFTDVAPQTGVEDIGAGMSVSWFDYDNDGHEDLYVTNMWTAAGERITAMEPFQRAASAEARAMYRKHAMGNSLLRNKSSFEDVTMPAGCGVGRWSWSSDAWDFDHDGHLDLYVANGMISGPVREDLNSFFWRQVVANSPNDVRPAPEYEQGWNTVNELIRSDYTWSGFERNVFFANNGDGTFSNVSAAVGLDFLEDGRAFALADFDHDGRQEVLLKNRSAPQIRLLKNTIDTLPASICFCLRGTKSNRDAIGAAITIETPAGRQTRRLQAGSGFLSQHSKEVFFGLGKASAVTKATIEWPSGFVQHLSELPGGNRIFVEEGSAAVRTEPFAMRHAAIVSERPVEELPTSVETWLIEPIPAPQFPSLKFSSGKATLFTIASASAIEEDVAAVYNLLYRYMFDRRRDLSLPTSFLIDPQGDIVKVYQGAVDAQRVERDISQIGQPRLALSLPYRGNPTGYTYGRNHLSLGSIFFQRGYYDQSETFFRLALRDNAASAEAHYGLGSVQLKLNQNAEARASFEQTVKLTPSYPETAPNAWNNLGLLAAREGRTDEAIRYFEEALKASPGYWIALQNLGNAYRQLKRFDKAQEAFERALAARPQDPETHYGLAMVFAQTGQSDRALKHFEKALELRPHYPEALNNLGILYLRTRRRDEAVASFEQCIKAAPAFDQAYLNLARVLAVEGQKDKARAVILGLLKLYPDHVQAKQMLEELR